MKAFFSMLRKSQTVLVNSSFFLVLAIIAITFGLILLNAGFGYPTDPATIAIPGLVATVIVSIVGNFYPGK